MHKVQLAIGREADKRPQSIGLWLHIGDLEGGDFGSSDEIHGLSTEGFLCEEDEEKEEENKSMNNNAIQLSSSSAAAAAASNKQQYTMTGGINVL